MEHLCAMMDAANAPKKRGPYKKEGGMKRKLSEAERGLVSFLLGREIPDTLEAEPMLEGMGSLRFGGHDNRKFGSCAAETRFLDADAVPVSAGLNLDQVVATFEVDLVKAVLISVQQITPSSD